MEGKRTAGNLGEVLNLGRVALALNAELGKVEADEARRDDCHSSEHRLSPRAH